jgi:hypothetical protein
VDKCIMTEDSPVSFRDCFSQVMLEYIQSTRY